MTPAQRQSRTALVARSDAALARWPDRKGREFVREMTEVAEGLRALAVTADRSGADAFERARTWWESHLPELTGPLTVNPSSPDLATSRIMVTR